MEFADLDDDLFSEERQRGNTDEEYSARFCERLWFLEAPPDSLVSDEDKLSVQKYSADYLYFAKNYEAAILKFENVLSITPAGNTTVRRECFEGITRSYIKTGEYDKAFDFAEKLHATSKTAEQTTGSCLVMIDAGIAAKKYLEALKAAQLLVSLNIFSSDAWLKLAITYACLYGINLPQTKKRFGVDHPINLSMKSGECSEQSGPVNNTKDKSEGIPVSIDQLKRIFCDSRTEEKCNVNELLNKIHSNPLIFKEEEKGLQFTCACLNRSVSMLKRTEGTSFGFALDSSLTWQNTVKCDMETILDEESLSFVKMAVYFSDDVYSRNSPLKEPTSEFVDRGSSKFQSDETELDVGEISIKSFERQWFKWIK